MCALMSLDCGSLPSAAFVAVAWLDPLVPKDSSSSGKVHSAKRGELKLM